jgi:hypothetical protein
MKVHRINQCEHSSCGKKPQRKRNARSHDEGRIAATLDQRSLTQEAKGGYPVQTLVHVCDAHVLQTLYAGCILTEKPADDAQLLAARATIAPRHASAVPVTIWAVATLREQTRWMVIAPMLVKAVRGGYREEITAKHQPPCDSA